MYTHDRSRIKSTCAGFFSLLRAICCFCCFAKPAHFTAEEAGDDKIDGARSAYQKKEDELLSYVPEIP